MRRKCIHNKRGFTLIELLVVISIISLLSSVVLSSLNSARAKARDAKRAEDVHQLKLALEYYYDANGVYPSVGTDNVGYSMSSLSAPLAPYIKTVPDDPGSNAWQYVRAPVNDASGYTYGLYVYREKTNAYCGTGGVFNPGWWSIGSNMC
ncbi:MAG TPA: prepilin-type N-terminal cleavage/methylation domain-containing protein, partial [Candidatus Paceibacterota bacterium]|nr:prepilin-type N-terminal cleavage/methylation domain-containing protein [Candidatus Paceibacterota bacterium]